MGTPTGSSKVGLSVWREGVDGYISYLRGQLAGLSQNAFVFKPGATPGGNVFASWATLGPAVALVRGEISILVDPSIAPVHVTSAFPVPDNVTFTSEWNSSSQMSFDAGAHMALGAGKIKFAGGTIAFFNAGADGEFFTLLDSEFFLVEIEELAEVFNGTTHAPFACNAGGQWTGLMEGLGNFGDGTHPMLDCSGDLLFEVLNDSLLDAHALKGTGNLVTINIDASSDIGAQDLTPLSINRIDHANRIAYTAAALANWNNVAPTSVANALDRIAAKIGPIP
jgi:hypothetical protein